MFRFFFFYPPTQKTTGSIFDKPKLERLKLKVEYKTKVKEARPLVKKVEQTIHNGLGVESDVELVPKGTIGRVLFKAQRVITTYK